MRQKALVLCRGRGGMFPPPSCDTKSWFAVAGGRGFCRPLSCGTKPWFCVASMGIMSAVSHSRHVCCVTQQHLPKRNYFASAFRSAKVHLPPFSLCRSSLYTSIKAVCCFVLSVALCCSFCWCMVKRYHINMRVSAYEQRRRKVAASK